MSTDTEKTNQQLMAASPGWFGWLFFLIGPCFLAAIYGQAFDPVKKADGWQFFERGLDDGLLLAGVLTTILFSGAGVSILAQQRRVLARSFDARLKRSHPDEPWKWRHDWAERRISPEKSSGHGLIFLWAALCVLSALPGLEIWKDRGWGWPDEKETVSAAAALAVALLTFVLTMRSLLRRRTSVVLHLAADTGIIGGPIEGGVEITHSAVDEIVIRLICERHWISRRKTSDGTTTEYKVDVEYTDTHQSTYRNGFFPIRFAIPSDSKETSREPIAPAFYWFVELESSDGAKLTRFPVPVFRTADSRDDFQLAASAADDNIDEELPEEVLRRYGIQATTNNEYGDTVCAIDVPPMRAPSLAFGLLLFGLLCLGVSMGMLFWGRDAFLYLFIVVFGFFGLLLTLLALPMLLERRHVEVDAHTIKVRRSYFGFGWTHTIPMETVKDIRVRHSGSSGQRVTFKNIVAVTDGMTRKDGSMMDRRLSIIASVPAEAAEAAKVLIDAQTSS